MSQQRKTWDDVRKGAIEKARVEYKKSLVDQTIKNWRFWVFMLPVATFILPIAFVLFLIGFLGEMLMHFCIGGMNGLKKYVVNPFAEIVYKNKQDES